MNLCLAAPLFHLFQLVCLLQFLNAAPSNTATNTNLPFEVDINSGNTGLDTESGNTGLDNGLTAQASKQGENFVASPKPADGQGFSFDSKPETTVAPVASSVTKKRPNTVLAPTSDTTVSKKKRKPIGDVISPVSASQSALPSADVALALDDPFFAYMLQDFLRQQQQLMNLFSSVGGLPGVGQLGGSSPFQMPSMDELQDSMNLDNMELVEDHVLDDSNGKGHMKTYKSKDGSAMVQTVTYNMSEDGFKGLQNLASASSAAQPVAAGPASLFSRPSLPRVTSPMNVLSSPRRMWVH